jgi:hypothetical protein
LNKQKGKGKEKEGGKRRKKKEEGIETIQLVMRK